MFSFVIPTYKNNESLLNCVNNLFTISNNKHLEFEIIVVDNYDSDEFVKVLFEINDSRLQILKNALVGAHYSRKKGLENSKGEVVIFVDDDNYLTEIYLDFIQEKSKIIEKDFFIGCVSKEYQPINWEILKFDSTSFACGSLENAKFKCNIPIFWGAGMCMSRELAVKIFNDDLIVEGRKDKLAYVMSGEDHELSLRSYLLGAESIYFSEVGLYHDINLDRLNNTYYNKLQIGFKYAAWILRIYYLRKEKSFFSRNLGIYFLYNLFMSFAYNLKHPLGYEGKLMIKDALSFNTIGARFNTVKKFI